MNRSSHRSVPWSRATWVLSVRWTSPLNVLPADQTPVSVPLITVSPSTVLPNTCTASAPSATRPPKIVLSDTTTDAPGWIVNPPRTLAFSRQVTPLETTTLPERTPVIVRVHSSASPGTTVARYDSGSLMLPAG